jgi:hypothetical protein
MAAADPPACPAPAITICRLFWVTRPLLCPFGELEQRAAEQASLGYFDFRRWKEDGEICPELRIQ